MIPVCVSFDVEVGSEETTLEVDVQMLLHCVPHVGSSIRPFEDMDCSKVRSVIFGHDASVEVYLEPFKYSNRYTVEGLRKIFADLGAKVW